jgi:hypothetical protein
MSNDSSSKNGGDVAQEPRRGWGPVEAVALGFLAYKIPDWLLTAIGPQLVPLLPFAKNVQSFILYALFELLVFAGIFGLIKLYGMTLRNIGLGTFKANFITLAGGGFFAYFILSVIIRQLVDSFYVVKDEVQQVGFINPTGVELVFVGLMLVVVVPLVEEVLFRGFLFKGVRKAFNFPITAIVVSVLFAVAHGQVDVGLDVFALSLVLCYLRERTNSIWPGILLHATKNGIAFLMLFVYNVH